LSFDLHHLRAFAAVANSGSLGRAANDLCLAQPALSRKIKRLEELLGAALFDRHSRGMQLTAAGRVLLPHAMLLLNETENAREEVEAIRGLSKGAIKVGTVGTIGSSILPLAIGHVLHKWPNLRVYVVEDVWDHLAEGLLRHEIDIAISVATDDTDEIVAIADCQWLDRSYVVCATNHPLRSRKDLTLAEVADAKWANTPKGTRPYEHLREAFVSQNLGLPNVVVETRSVVVLKGLLIHSGFLGWMAEPMFETEKKANLIDKLPIAGLEAKRTLMAFRRRHGLLPTPAAKLRDELKRLSTTPCVD
jgi:DNA-binding transcriptional LysR family regulator